jgi:hypothetical protein
MATLPKQRQKEKRQEKERKRIDGWNNDRRSNATNMLSTSTISDSHRIELFFGTQNTTGVRERYLLNRLPYYLI